MDAQTHEKIMTGKLENKFGIPINSALEVYRIASELNSIKIVGIDLHIGSQITDILPFETAFLKIASFIKKLIITFLWRRWISAQFFFNYS